MSRQPWFSILLFLPASVMAAPTPPDAGQNLQQIQRAPELPTRNAPVLQRPAETTRPFAADANGSIQVRAFHITGATRFAESELQQQIADGRGKRLTVADLHALAQRITTFYREHGYLTAKAYLPAQDIRDGTVRFDVLEGRYGRIAIDNAGNAAGAAVGAIAATIPGGAVIEESALERRLLLLSDLPGVQAHATLAPGQATGTADLKLAIERGPRVSGRLSVDNFGNRYTGRVRGGASFNVNDPFGLGDRLALNLLSAGEGLNFLHTGYDLPIGAYGTRLGVGYNFLHYKLGEPFARTDADGDLHHVSVFLTHPLIRSRRLNLYGTVGYDYKRIDDRIDDTRRSRDNHRGSAGVQLDGTDPFGGTGSLAFAAAVGHIELTADTAAQRADAVGPRTAGSYGKFTLQGLRLQEILPDVTLYLAVQGQAATRNLDSSEKFFLGGPYGVRAYPQGEASGDHGYLVSAELRYRLPFAELQPGTLQIAGFFDHGRSFLYANRWGGVRDDSRALQGAGVGLSYTAPFGLSLRGDVAFPIGPERARSDTDKSAQFWLSATQAF